ncbi:hypothetical protein SUGI_1227940 [Cryptomeria japonica]|uniref:Uncharacterized protein n=1 Tax=Cryptomeria japonica TaxID=3369 RepID=A0AAD3NN22_CRYJA|nr:hypothetical protein SUGI_1227940 [Cryptomeria japonica]
MPAGLRLCRSNGDGHIDGSPNHLISIYKMEWERTGTESAMAKVKSFRPVHYASRGGGCANRVRLDARPRAPSSPSNPAT